MQRSSSVDLEDIAILLAAASFAVSALLTFVRLRYNDLPNWQWFAAATVITGVATASALYYQTFSGPPTQQVTVRFPTMDKRDYRSAVESCAAVIGINSLRAEPQTAATILPAVSVLPDGELNFRIGLLGQSPGLALRDPGYRERIYLDLSIVRDFNDSDVVVGTFSIAEAKRAKGLENDVLQDGRYVEYDGGQRELVLGYVREIAAFFSDCMLFAARQDDYGLRRLLRDGQGDVLDDLDRVVTAMETAGRLAISDEELESLERRLRSTLQFLQTAGLRADLERVIRSGLYWIQKVKVCPSTDKPVIAGNCPPSTERL